MSFTKVSHSLATLLAMFAIAISGPVAHATVLITEINSNGTGGDFFEIYNSGASAVDLTGWRWSDYDVRNWASAQSFDAITLNAGEVAVVGVGNNSASPTPLFGSAAANTAFRTSWGLSGSVKMPTWTGTGGGLGQGDGIILFNAAGNHGLPVRGDAPARARPLAREPVRKQLNCRGGVKRDFASKCPGARAPHRFTFSVVIHFFSEHIL